MSDLPAEIKTFVTRYIRSLAHLEVLLFLFQRPSQTWAAEALSREMRTNRNYALEQLRELANLGVIKGFGDESFIYESNEQLDATLHETYLVYQKRRVSLIDLFYSRRIDRIRSFSDAFKIKKDDE